MEKMPSYRKGSVSRGKPKPKYVIEEELREAKRKLLQAEKLLERRGGTLSLLQQTILVGRATLEEHFLDQIATLVRKTLPASYVEIVKVNNDGSFTTLSCATLHEQDVGKEEDVFDQEVTPRRRAWETKNIVIVNFQEESAIVLPSRLKKKRWRGAISIPVEGNEHGDFLVISAYTTTLIEVEAHNDEFFTHISTLINLMRKEKRTRIQEAQEQQTDPLTGLFGRRWFKEKLPDIEALLSSYQSILLILLDLDYFKRINDTYGHAIGDEVLHHCGERLEQEFRETDLKFRWGGDEMLIAIPVSPQDEAAIEHIAYRVYHIFEEPFVCTSEILRVTASVGLYLWHQGETFDQAYLPADQALYLAKERGRNQVVWGRSTLYPA